MSTLSFLRHSWGALTLAVLSSVLPTVALAQNDQDPRVPNVETAYTSLKERGEFIGFRHLDGTPYPDGVPTDQHWQGIARSAGTGTPYLYVTRSGSNSSTNHGNLVVVEMASRDKHGGRLRSNQLKDDTNPESQAAPTKDRIVYNYNFTDYNHAGGIQRIGNVLIVPLEGKNNDNDPEGKLAFFSLDNPRQPIRLSTMLTTDHKIGVVGATRLPDQTYLIALTWGDNDKVEFYKSTTTNLRNTAFIWLREWLPSYITSGTWYTQGTFQGTYQALNFITQTDGTIYLLGTRNSLNSGLGDDKMQLFKVTNPSTGSINLQEVQSERHMICDSNHGNFAAGAGVHVSPDGDLMLYSIEYYRTGPSSTYSVGEFVSRNNTVPDYGSDVAWIELYENTSYGGRRLILDSRDRFYGKWGELSKMQGSANASGNFNDTATSARWHAPLGTVIRAYENTNNTGSFLEFTGDGSSANLGASWNDRISSVTFTLGDPGPTLIVETDQFDFIGAYATLPLLTMPYTRLRLIEQSVAGNLLFFKPVIIEANGTTPSVLGAGSAKRR